MTTGSRKRFDRLLACRSRRPRPAPFAERTAQRLVSRGQRTAPLEVQHVVRAPAGQRRTAVVEQQGSLELEQRRLDQARNAVVERPQPLQRLPEPTPGRVIGPPAFIQQRRADRIHRRFREPCDCPDPAFTGSRSPDRGFRRVHGRRGPSGCRLEPCQLRERRRAVGAGLERPLQQSAAAIRLQPVPPRQRSEPAKRRRTVHRGRRVRPGDLGVQSLRPAHVVADERLTRGFDARQGHRARARAACRRNTPGEHRSPNPPACLHRLSQPSA